MKAKQTNKDVAGILNSLFAARLAGALWKLGCAAESHERSIVVFEIMLQKAFRKVKLFYGTQQSSQPSAPLHTGHHNPAY